MPSERTRNLKVVKARGPITAEIQEQLSLIKLSGGKVVIPYHLVVKKVVDPKSSYPHYTPEGVVKIIGSRHSLVKVFVDSDYLGLAFTAESIPIESSQSDSLVRELIDAMRWHFQSHISGMNTPDFKESNSTLEFTLT